MGPQGVWRHPALAHDERNGDMAMPPVLPADYGGLDNGRVSEKHALHLAWKELHALVLDGVVESAIGVRDGGLERVEIDHHQIDRLDARFAQCVHVRGRIAPRQQAAVDFRMRSANFGIAIAARIPMIATGTMSSI